MVGADVVVVVVVVLLVLVVVVDVLVVLVEVEVDVLVVVVVPPRAVVVLVVVTKAVLVLVVVVGLQHSYAGISTHLPTLGMDFRRINELLTILPDPSTRINPFIFLSVAISC